MTLIALTLNQGHPVLMADLLMSSSESDGVIEIPTFVKGTGSLLVNMESKPAVLKQKLYVINNRLCIALGGRCDQMFSFLNRITARLGDESFTDEEFEKFFEHYETDDLSQVIAIVLKSKSVDDSFKFDVKFIGNFDDIASDEYERVIASGSGAKQFLEFVNQDIPSFSDLPDVDRVLGVNQYLISYWLGHETVSAESLQNNWGGGFEMIFFRDGRFQKLQRYTVALLMTKIGREIKFQPAPFNIIMAEYFDGLLVIRGFSRGIEKVFIVPALNERRKEVTLPDHEPKHETLLITYIIENVENGKTYFPTIALLQNENKLGESPIIIERVADKLRVYTDQQTDAYVHNLVVEMIKQETK